MSVSQKSLVAVFAAVVGGAALIAACSSDDDAPSGGTTSGTPGAPGGPGAPGAGEDGDDDAGGGSEDRDGSDGRDGGESDKELGASCNGDAECASGACFKGGSGGGGGSTAGFCTKRCTMLGQEGDPTCADPALSGKCNNKGFCQAK